MVRLANLARTLRLEAMEEVSPTTLNENMDEASPDPYENIMARLPNYQIVYE